MINKIILHSKAIKELNQAIDWYAVQQQGLGDEFLDAIDWKLNQIANRPEAYFRKNSNYREAIVNKFPYVIVFRMDKAKKTIMVVAIHHTSRKPRKRFPGK